MTRKRLSDNEMDALVVRSLARLPRRAPARGFSDRVMNRVQLPPARPLLVYRRARAWLAQPRRALTLAAGYALAATVALLVAVPWVLANSPAISFAVDWTAGRMGALVRDVVLGAAGWAVSSGLTGLFREIKLSGPQFWAAAGLLAVGYAGAAVGLHALLRTPRGTDAPAKLSA